MSSLKEQINADLKSAMISRDTVKTQTLQGLKASILNEEVAKKLRQTGLDEAQIEQIVAREAKKRDEAVEFYEQAGNLVSAEKERLEKKILQVYLPDQLAEDDIRQVVEAVVAELKPDGVKDMGRVIGAVRAKLGNSADGAIVARLVKDSLQ